ncbi:phosphate ABC transporter permease subunit PstC [Candidatus Leptofilum sp.]|uniref:phosphate ABC transporter permease subunit PstC n=1 Tax=Candidatus Leptofilum sp. TaxID=3241576 RepID=UPI003B59A63E
MATQNPATPMVGTAIRAGELAKKPRIGESIIQTILFVCGAISILTTVGIVYILGSESLNFFTKTNWEDTNKRLVVDMSQAATTLEAAESGAAIEVGETIRLSDEIMEVTAINGTIVSVARGVDGSEIVPHNAGVTIERATDVSVWDTLTSTNWTPQLGNFGLWPLILATMMTSVIAMLVALPVGLATAIYLSEYASEKARSTLKPILEVLAGVPTVVYGYFALTFMTPLLRSLFGLETVKIFNTASAGIVVGILIIPLVTSMSEDALHAVPDSLRQAAYGLGATKLETSLRIVLPAALSGITAAFVVAISRAIGETMVVAIAAGSGPKNFDFGEDSLFGYILNPFESAETMTGHIVRISGGDLSYDSIDYNSIFAIGLGLFLMTLTLNIISRRIVAKYREVYE